MRKLVLLNLFIILLFSCKDSGKIAVDLSQGEFKQRIIPNSVLTSSCALEFTGETDCDLLIYISSEKSFKLDKGKIKVSKKYECYEKGKTIRILSENCSSQSKLEIDYSFSKGYFGQSK